MRGRALLLAAAVCAVLSGCAKDTPAIAALYDHAPVPAVPDRTLPVADLPKDGEYWATAVAVKDGALVFELAQAFFGPACTTELGAAQCAGDHGTIDAGQVRVTVAAKDLTTVSVVDSQQQNFAVTAAELLNLVAGGKPAATAPADYAYIDDPFLLTVAGGVVETAQQIWIP